MSRKTQRYSKKFKAEAVRTVLENQLSISEGASRLSLPEGTLGQWVTAARKGLGTPGSRTVAELESEILQLRKALNEARLERDILTVFCKNGDITNPELSGGKMPDAGRNMTWDLRAPAPTPSHLRATVAIKGSFRGAEF